MPRKPIAPLNTDAGIIAKDQIDCSLPVNDNQLKNAKLFASRESYIKTLPQNIRYMEVGVAWGYYSDLVIAHSNPQSVDLLDTYDQDLKCWSWRKFGSCQCEGMKHTMLYTPATHKQYIIDKYSYVKNLNIISGDCRTTLPKLKNIKEYDYIYLDVMNWREVIRPTLKHASELVSVGGIIGLNDYLIYDGIIEDLPYATFQVTNEFLFHNKNWEVDALALHPLGFYDIYLRKVA